MNYKTKKRKVMVVDDDTDYLDEIDAFLKLNSFSVKTVGHANEALASALKFKPDIVLLDLKMDGISGVQVFRELKDNPETVRIPVLIVTGAYNNCDSCNLLKMYGIQEIMLKPFDYHKLVSKMEEMMSVNNLSY